MKKLLLLLILLPSLSLALPTDTFISAATISVNDPANVVRGYYVYCKTESGAYIDGNRVDVGLVDTVFSSTIAPLLVIGTNYCSVTAYDEGSQNESPFSNELTIELTNGGLNQSTLPTPVFNFR